MLHALRADDVPATHLSRVDPAATRLQRFLHELDPHLDPADIANPTYRRAQLRWRAAGHACPALTEEGSCVVHEARPLACRVHVHVEDPTRCDPGHPDFAGAERPPLWGHPLEADVEQRLEALSRAMGLAGPRALPLALAAALARG